MSIPHPPARLLHFALGLLLSTLSTVAQPSQPPVPRVYRERIDPRWIPDSPRFWYRNANPDDTQEFILVDTRAGTRAPAFDHAAVARAIGGDARSDRLPVHSLEFIDGTTALRLIGDRISWDFDASTGQLSPRPDAAAPGSALRPLETFAPSRAGGRDTHLTFDNSLDREVLLFWFDPQGRRVAYGTLRPGKPHRQNTYSGHVWLVTELDGRDPIAAFEAEASPARVVIQPGNPKPKPRERPPATGRAGGPVRSPDGKLEAFVRDHQLWLRRLDPPLETQLTRDGTPTHSYRRHAIRERAIGMDYDRADPPDSTPEVFWAPDSRRFVALKSTVVEEPRVHLIESSPPDRIQPRTLSYPYLKPGDPIPEQEVRWFEVEPARELPVVQSLFTNAWDLSHFSWNTNTGSFQFLFNERGHQRLRVLDLSPADQGIAARPLFEETAAAGSFIDYSQKTLLRHLASRGLWLWMSERDGWNHLYAFDDRTGALVARLTRGTWMVHSLEHVSADESTVWLWVMGIHPGEDPYHKHLCRVDIPPRHPEGTLVEAAPPRILTAGDGDHSVQWAPDRACFIDTYSRVDQPPVHELRRADDGRLMVALERADAAEVLAGGGAFPERFTAKGRDGTTDIWGILHRPHGFDPSRRYPVIENIYAGPHGAHVPKTFRAFYRHQQEIANAGFVVVQIDGMGTNWRGKRFHDVAWKNLRDAGFPDRIAWLRAAATTRPWLDLSRVGIYGGSAGGQNAMRAVLDHADFYRAAAADCGCHDNRLDKIWWNEAWLGWPVDESYARSSNAGDAHRLGGALLLTVGELDRNVDPSSTYRVVDALRRANKRFEFMPITGAGHGAAESDFGRRLRLEFFKRHLLDAPPRG